MLNLQRIKMIFCPHVWAPYFRATQVQPKKQQCVKCGRVREVR